MVIHMHLEDLLLASRAKYFQDGCHLTTLKTKAKIITHPTMKPKIPGDNPNSRRLTFAKKLEKLGYFAI